MLKNVPTGQLTKVQAVQLRGARHLTAGPALAWDGARLAEELIIREGELGGDQEVFTNQDV